MKNVNLIVITTVIATFIISMITFQPIATEASSKVVPAMTPSPRTIKKKINQPIEVENNETHRTKKPSTTLRIKKPTSAKGRTETVDNNETITNNANRTKRITKAPTSTGDQPEMQIIKSNKPKGFSDVSGLTQETQQRKNSRRNSAQYNPKEIGVDKIKAKNNVSLSNKSTQPKLNKRKVKPKTARNSGQRAKVKPINTAKPWKDLGLNDVYLSSIKKGTKRTTQKARKSGQATGIRKPKPKP